MNIFYLHKEPTTCAEFHCDKHVVKMILESAQMLSTAHRVLDGETFADHNRLYKLTHGNHPSNVWLRASNMNYRHLYELFIALCDEYTYRYGKIHATDAKLRIPLAMTPRNIVNGPMSQPPQCMPDEYKEDNSINGYRNYYLGEKAYMCKWTKREIPAFMNCKTTRDLRS